VQNDPVNSTDPSGLLLEGPNPPSSDLNTNPLGFWGNTYTITTYETVDPYFAQRLEVPLGTVFSTTTTYLFGPNIGSTGSLGNESSFGGAFGQQPSESDIIESSVNDALDRLKDRPACKDLLTGVFSPLPRTNPIKFLKELRSDEAIKVVDNLTNLFGERLIGAFNAFPNSIQLDRELFFQSPTVGGVTRPVAGIELSQEQARTLIILHEIGHATAAWSSFHLGFQSWEDEFDRKIYEACIK
jgi:hypothetical protein